MTILPQMTPQMTPALSLAEALVALVCHDLSSPLGTLSSALELADEDPDTADEARGLAREAAVRMAARLRLLRAVWGGDTGALSRAALQELLAALPPRVTVAMDDLGGDDFPGPVARVLLSAALLGAEALPRGGVVALAGAADDVMTVMPHGQAAAWPPGLSLALAHPAHWTADQSNRVQAPVLAYLAGAAGMRATLLMPPGPTGPTCPPLLLARLT